MYNVVDKDEQFKKDETFGFPVPKILERGFKVLNMKDIDITTILWALTGLNYTAVKVLEMLLNETLTVLEISSRIDKSRSWVQKLLGLLFKYGLVERTWVSSQQKYFYKISNKAAFFNALKHILNEVYREVIKFLSKDSRLNTK
nr:helix-turn-helix domain-containing protein [Candidatus Baldrarchaeota archaeon]